MIAFQRQLNLRNRDVIISNPQKKVIYNQAYTSELNKNSDPKGVTNSQSKGKELVNKEVSKDKAPLHTFL